MIPRAGTTRRFGVALLVVLAALVIAVTAAVTIASVASTARLAQSVDDRARLANELGRAAEAPIIDWLTNESAEVVLPPAPAPAPEENTTSWPEPRVEVLHDQWTVNGQTFELHITAWDQLGMVPINIANAGLPLRLAVPEHALQAVDDIELPEEQAAGLDLFVGREAIDVNVFPKAPNIEPVLFGDGSDGGSMSNESNDGSVHQLAAIGAVLATHHASGQRINIHTAPIEVVEAAMREAGRGGLEAIIAARENGEQISLGSLPQLIDPNDQAPQLVTQSDTWAFRVDARVDLVRKSWWSIYRRHEDSWKCVQRLVITE